MQMIAFRFHQGHHFEQFICLEITMCSPCK